MRVVVFYEDKGGNEQMYIFDEHFRKIKSFQVYDEDGLEDLSKRGRVIE